MYNSGEVRWYFEGTLPKDIRYWFESSGHGTEEPERTDEYLLLPGCESTSVKVREGRFEVKVITRMPSAEFYPNNVVGMQDAWVKWSRKASDIVAFRDMISSPVDKWAFVKKSRFLRKFSLDTGFPVEVSAAEDRPDLGCQVEITSIKALVSTNSAPPSSNAWPEAALWWSLSLEAFAPEAPGVTETVISNLGSVANHFFRKAPPFSLKIASSFSYPAWLSRLT